MKKYINARHFLPGISFLFVFCATNLPQDNGKAVVAQKTTGNSTTLIKGFIKELSTGDPLKLSDIWIADKRVVCDTTGAFSVEFVPGTHTLDARAFGFKNFKYKFQIRKGENIVVDFYLAAEKTTN